MRGDVDNFSPPFAIYVKFVELHFFRVAIENGKEYNVGISRETGKRKRLYRESDE